MIPQLTIVQMKGRIAHFGPRFPVYDSAAYRDYFSHPTNENIYVSNCKQTEGTSHLNSFLTNTRYEDFSLAKFCASSRKG